MTKNKTLEINMIPQTAWYKNLRSKFSRPQWDYLRKDCYKKAGYRCEVCDGTGLDQGFKWPVECHEVWDFSVWGKQKLVRLIALCPMCHKCQHPGLAQIQGYFESCLQHYSNVNECTTDEARLDFNAAYDQWQERSQTEWKLDITALAPEQQELLHD